MASIFDTVRLDGVVEQHRGSVTGYLGWLLFEGPVIVSQETLAIDIVDIAEHGVPPHCDPGHGGTQIDKVGYKTEFFKPPVRHYKTVLGRTDSIERLPGEAPLGTLSPEERLAALAGIELERILRRIDEGRECDAASAIVNGYFDASWKESDGQTKTRRYTFDASPQSSTVSNAWGSANADPLGDLLAIRASVAGASGTVADQVVMNSATFAKFIASPKVAEALRAGQASFASLDVNRKPESIGGFYVGRCLGFDVHVVDEAYSANASTLTKLIPDNMAIVCSRGAAKMFYGIADTLSRPADNQLIISAGDYITNAKVADEGLIVEATQAALPAILKPKAFWRLTTTV